MRVGLEQLEGQRIAGRFRLKQLLDKGGYGAVFDAEQISMQRRCAVKVLLPWKADDPTVEKRFRAEAKTTSRLNHPNTVVVYDFGVDEATGYLFLVTEFLDGMTVHQLLCREGTLGVERTLSILEQTAASLADAHDRGLIHRDVKPRNIMLVERAGQQEFVKVIDFGIAKALEGELVDDLDLTKTGMLIGTPQYLAPEFLLGNSADWRADQYALALVGYRMLTGHNPFKGTGPVDTAMRHCNDEPLPLRAYNPHLEVSQRFEQVFLQALTKNPTRRHESVLAFVEALREAAESTSWSADAQPEAATVGKPTLQLDTVGGTVGQDEDVAQFPSVCTEAITPLDSEEDCVTTATKNEQVPPQSRQKKTVPLVGKNHWFRVAAAGSLVLFVVVTAVVIAHHSAGQSDEQPPNPPAEQPEGASQQQAQPSHDQSDDAGKQEVADAAAALGDAVVNARNSAVEAVEEHVEQKPQRQPEDSGDAADEPAEVTVTLIPWGTLYVDGQRRSDEMRQQLELQKGRYELSLRQQGNKKAVRVVDVEPGQSKMVTLEAEFSD